jgi:phosphatidylglycerol:prolipoprotein diacylglycerol transferase
VRPILLELPFGLPLYGYGAMLCLSIIAGRFLALRLAGRIGMDARTLDRCCIWTLVGAFIGSRLLFVVTNLNQLNGIVDVLAFWNGGMVAYGGFLGGFVASALFCRVHRIPLLAWADCAVPALALGLMLTRIGCFLGGCDFGQPWDGPWSVTFPVGSPAFNQQMLDGLLPAGATQSLPVHPTQLYESIAGFALLILVLAVHRRRTFSGQTFVAFTAGYAVLRFLIEIVRADAGRGAIGPLSTSQFIAVATLVSVAALSYVLRRRSISLRQPEPSLSM